MTVRFSFERGVTLAGGAGFSAADLEEALALAPELVAADGGAETLVALGTAPQVIIGDMDSTSDLDGWRARTDVEVLHLEEQETTDLEKCLYSIAAPFFIGVGFLGRRFDHSLAALHALARWNARPALLLAEEEVAFLCPPNWRVRLDPGARVSLFPLAPVRALGSSGLEWPLDGPIFAPGARIGTSNVAAANEVASRFSARAMVCLLERRYLGAALDSLLDATPRPGRR